MTTDSTSIQSFKQPFYRQAGLVVILAALFGGLLAGAQIILTPVIEANKLNETMTHIPSLVDALGNPLDFILTGGQSADVTQT